MDIKKTFPFLFIACLHALPQSPQVVSGELETLLQTSESLELKVSDKTMIEWEDFSIQMNETARFIQPTEQSILVNRVMGNAPIEIFGALKSNGQVILINPNGVVFGKNSQVDVNTLMASTFDLNKDLFFSTGELDFTGSSIHSIVNEGVLRASDCIGLFAHQVVQNGIIDSGKSAALVASNDFIVKSTDLDRIHVRTYSPNASISLEGSISIPGGTVDILGTTVLLKPSSLVDVSSLQSGKGGTITIWSDLETHTFGTILAKGGSYGGDGGFIEVSSKGHLNPQGIISTLAPMGNTGTLLLDPTNVCIANNGGVDTCTAGPGYAFACNAATPCGFLGATIDSGNLTAFLAGNNVTISTNAATDQGQAGLLTVRAGANINWNSGNSLTLISASNMVINANIQESNAVNTAANRVTLISGANITLQPLLSGIIVPPANSVSVGSQNGGTLVNAAGNILLQGSLVDIQGQAQIGYWPPGIAPIVSTGDIVVNCGGNLSLLTGTTNQTSALIGHGAFNIAGPILGPGPEWATMGADITVNVGGNAILTAITNFPAFRSYAHIGHGANTLFYSANDNQDGNIAVNIGGNLSLFANGSGNAAAIGHGFVQVIGVAGTVPSISGNIDVNVGGDISMTTGPIQTSDTAIGHHLFQAGPIITAITGNLHVCARNVTIAPAASGAASNIIGHNTQTVTTFTGTYLIDIRGDLVMTDPNVTNNSVFIGTLGNTITNIIPNVTMYMAVGGNATLTSQFNTVTNFGIGFASNTGGASSLFLMVGGNLTAQGPQSVTIGCRGGDCNVAVGGNFFVNATGSPSTVGTNSQGLTRLFAGGNLIGQGNVTFGATRTPGFIFSASDDFRAGGNMQIPASITLPAVGGFINMIYGHAFQAGELYTANTIVDPPQNFLTFCPVLGTSAATTAACSAFTTPSTLNFNVRSGPLRVSMDTGQTDLANFCDGLCPNAMTIGPGGTFTFTNVALNHPDNVVFGAGQLTLNQALTSTGTVAGTNLGQVSIPFGVVMNACQDLTISPAANITATVANAPISLTADANSNCSGDIHLQANVTSNNGDVFLSAGRGTFNCASSNCNCVRAQGLPICPAGSSIIQSGTSQVSSGSGTIYATAATDITISGSNPSMASTTGNIFLTAGHDLTINQRIQTTQAGGGIFAFAGNNTTLSPLSAGTLVSTLGEIRMVTGRNMVLETNAIILSTQGPVTLVVDNNHPVMVTPLAPPVDNTNYGSFTMNAGSGVSSGNNQPLRIYTAISQASNTSGVNVFNLIDPTAMLNGYSVYDPLFGYPTQLFNDTAYEQYCSYFGCPFPYTYFGSGFPFTIFYKPCLISVMTQATIVVDEFLIDLHPYNEFPGWLEHFWVQYRSDNQTSSSLSLLPSEGYTLRRRHLNIIHQPKTWTVLLPE
ncbi:MAG: filamentous hemagglutinin N-terminal domain-containing protein [Parachlamydiales bacterium]|nr:filamentous hemagglutinin N-terminal domain-containing protein [Parachlamydiales bacterium]